MEKDCYNKIKLSYPNSLSERKITSNIFLISNSWIAYLSTLLILVKLHDKYMCIENREFKNYRSINCHTKQEMFVFAFFNSSENVLTIATDARLLLVNGSNRRYLVTKYILPAHLLSIILANI